MTNKNITLIIIISLGIISRLIYHIPNFTPIFSICLFSGMMFKNTKKMYFVPLACMFITDLFLGIHSTILFVYVSLLIVIFIGRINSNSYLFSRLIISIFLSNIVFFMITNFGVWFMQIGYYDKTFSGLMTCYIAAIPFFKNALLSNLIFTPILIYSYKYIIKRYPVLLNT